jgi:three-Cys-motif partner protein
VVREVTKNFFDAARPQSKLKAEIVEAYFVAWARVMTGSANNRPPHFDRRIAYIDLFAGPGRYSKDGALSTPLRVLQKAIANTVFADRLVAVFNDKDPANVERLQREVAALPGIERLRYPPKYLNREIDASFSLESASVPRVPRLTFLDPFGYKGISLGLVNEAISGWGCDCLLFFNYVRINAALSNKYFKDHMEAIFGRKRVAALREKLAMGTPGEREIAILQELSGALDDTGQGKRYAVSFCFKSESGKKTKHHLILITKSYKAYNLMKTILDKRSSHQLQGVPSLTYTPVAEDPQGILFGPLDDLRSELRERFAGRSLAVSQLIEEHSVGRNFVEANYRAVLKELLEEGAISATPLPKKGTFGDSIVVTFAPLRQ